MVYILKKIKKRYIIIRTKISDKEELLKKLVNAIMYAFGLEGLSRTRPTVIYSKDNKHVVAIDKDGVDYLRAALVFSLYEDVKILRITGTSRKAKRIMDSLK